jgi:hypothetical protein
MPVTRAEWNARRATAAPRSTANLEVIAREALRAEAVTGDENWDHFLTHLEANIRATEVQLEAEDRKLRSPYLVNDEQIRTLKAHITRLEERIRTLKEVLMLPKYLKQHGDLARAQIADLAKSS